jgi:hypothetical protein
MPRRFPPRWLITELEARYQEAFPKINALSMTS